MMRYFETTYQVADGIFSVNVIKSNCGREDFQAASETAERHAAKHGYQVLSVREINESQVIERMHKGMPMYFVDDQAEREHDPSFEYEAEITKYHELLQEAGELESKLAEIEIELAGLTKILQRAGINPLEVDL
jgi:hypothetical protein